MIRYLIIISVLFFVGFSVSADLPPPRVIDLDTICCDGESWMVAIGNFLLAAGMVLAVIVIVFSGIRM